MDDLPRAVEGDEHPHTWQEQAESSLTGREGRAADIADALPSEPLDFADDPRGVLPGKVTEILFRRRLPDDLEAHGFGRTRCRSSSLETPAPGWAIASSKAMRSSSVSDSSGALSNAATAGSSTDVTEGEAGLGAFIEPSV
jgi:hypothetical protein